MELIAESGQGQRYLKFYWQKNPEEETQKSSPDLSRLNISASEASGGMKAGADLNSTECFNEHNQADVVTD